MIEVGARIPDATLTESTEFGEACPVAPTAFSVAEALAGKRVVVFGLPGAYTPTCSANHVPGFLANLDAFKAKKVDEVWCLSVNDGYVMAAWGRDQHAIGKIRFVGDGTADFTKKLGLQMEHPTLGLRCRRFSMLVDDGVVKHLNVEDGGKLTISDAATLLAQLA